MSRSSLGQEGRSRGAKEASVLDEEAGLGDTRHEQGEYGGRGTRPPHIHAKSRNFVARKTDVQSKGCSPPSVSAPKARSPHSTVHTVCTTALSPDKNLLWTPIWSHNTNSRIGKRALRTILTIGVQYFQLMRHLPSNQLYSFQYLPEDTRINRPNVGSASPVSPSSTVGFPHGVDVGRGGGTICKLQAILDSFPGLPSRLTTFECGRTDERDTSRVAECHRQALPRSPGHHPDCSNMGFAREGIFPLPPSPEPLSAWAFEVSEKWGGVRFMGR